jgi:hypothetical protein
MNNLSTNSVDTPTLSVLTQTTNDKVVEFKRDHPEIDCKLVDKLINASVAQELFLIEREYNGDV